MDSQHSRMRSDQETAAFLPHTPPHRLCPASQHRGVSQNAMVFISWSSPALTTAVDVLPNMRGSFSFLPGDNGEIIQAQPIQGRQARMQSSSNGATGALAGGVNCHLIVIVAQLVG